MKKDHSYLVLFLFLLVISCAHKPILEPEVTYRKTLKFSVNGEHATGTFSAKKKPLYRMEIFVPQKPNLVKLTSCHQERIFIKPGKSFEFDYRPNADIEAGELPCIVEISALEESGKNQWGMIDFQLPSENLKSRVRCNGEVFDTTGSAICQSRVDLVQSIEFDRTVTSHMPDDCNTIEPNKGNKFYFSVTEGNCFYLFSDGAGGVFRLVTFGYNETLIDD